MVGLEQLNQLKMAQSINLRPITHRLLSTPVKDLPRIAQFLASSLSSCAGVLRSSDNHTASASEGVALQIHKLKTRISSLLQDRAPEGRYTAVVLIKTIVEVGGRPVLSGCEPWARGLLSLLRRNDSNTVKKLCIITITRIFVLTQPYPTLIREITTPLLPAFVTVCLSCVKLVTIRHGDESVLVLSPLLETVLRCLTLLIPHHPAIFRPFVSRWQPIAISVIGDPSAHSSTADAAGNLLALLHFSAPKNSGSSELVQTYHDIITSCHTTADEVFRSLIEDWESSDGSSDGEPHVKTYNKTVGVSATDNLGLQPWQGFVSGAQRIARLLRLLSRFVTSAQAQLGPLPVGRLLDLSSRITSCVFNGTRSSTRSNVEVSREEREELMLYLPGVHMAALELLTALLKLLSMTAMPLVRPILTQLVRVFYSDSLHEDVRAPCYRLMCCLLPMIGPSASKDDLKLLTPIIHSCCADLLPSVQLGDRNADSQPGVGKSKTNGFRPVDADAFATKQTNKSQESSATVKGQTWHEAFALLPLFLMHLPTKLLSASLRIEIDRTGILIQHKDSMVASVLNPPQSADGRYAVASIMPLLARTETSDLAIESLLRPRMPFVRSPGSDGNEGDVMEEGESSDDEDEESPGGHLLDELEATVDKESRGILEPQRAEPVQVMSKPDANTTQSAEAPTQAEPVLGQSGKRNLDALQADEVNETDALDIGSKRPKFEAEPSSRPMTEPDGYHSISNGLTTNQATVKAPNTQPLAEDAPVVPQSSSYMPSHPSGHAGDDSDSSFEIPKINIDPDTESEDEME